MSTNPNNIPIVPTREQLHLSQVDDARHEPEIPTVDVPAPCVIPHCQLEWMMSTIANLESRLATSDPRAMEHRFPSRPDSDPPYAVPISSSVRASHLQQQFHPTVTEGQFPHQPHIPPPEHSNNGHFNDITAHNRPLHNGFYPSQPFSQILQPPAHGMDNLSQYRPPFGPASIGAYNPPFQFDRPVYSNLPGRRPTSCWYPSPDRPTRGSQLQDQHRGVRMDPPRFDGSDAANWIFKIQYYFDHMMMPDANKLHYVVPLFDPPATEWIKHYCSNNDFVTWQEFLNEVRYRFDPDCYESYIGLIAKLCQNGTVSEYQLEFEHLQNKLSGVPDYILLPIYIASNNHFSMSGNRGFQESPELHTLLRPVQTPPQRSHHKCLAPSSARYRMNDLGKLPVVRLSGAEKADRSRRGLCWYCDEKWVPGQVCKQNFLAYMGDEDVDDQEPDSSLPEDNVITTDLSHLNAIHIRRRAKSINMVGTLHATAVNILVDTGSSHAFIHPRLAEKLSLR